MILTKTVTTPDRWLPLAGLLTKTIVSAEMTTRTDCVVKISDDDDDSLPIAWHVPATSDIVLNARKVKGMDEMLKLSYPRMTQVVNQAINGDAMHWSIGRGLKATSTPAYLRGDRTTDEARLAATTIRGVLAHEAAHSKWSHYLMEPWFQDLSKTPEGTLLARVISQLDEVRIEAMQIDEHEEFRVSLRSSANLILPSAEDLENIMTGEGLVNVFEFGLTSIISLGRADLGILYDYEVRKIWDVAEDILGFGRLQDMRDIWIEFAMIEKGDEEELMPALAQQWIDLFKNGDGDGPGDGEGGEMIAMPGIIEVMKELMAEVAEDVVSWSESATEDGRPIDMKDPRREAESVFTESGKRRGHARDPEPWEHAAAMRMAKQLEKLSVHARSVKDIRTLTPPGRLHTRSAVSQAAARAQGRASTEEPWGRKVRKYSDTPKLTVGVATDISGSMRWAEGFVASASWIIARAVRHVNGTVATVTFGESAEKIIGPADKLDKVIVRSANGGSEAFNSATAALDGVLRLTDPSNGVRILFVVSDGELVAPGEMEAMHSWVKKLSQSGCLIVWVTDEPEGHQYRGSLCTPPPAKRIHVEEPYGLDQARMIDRMVREVLMAFGGHRG